MTSGDPPRIGGYSRDELRRSYAEAWRKHRARAPLTPLESLITEVIAAHPEYQSVVGTATQALAHESAADEPAENPFLHMGLHIAVREQIAVDRPPGMRELKRALAARLDEHAAEHVLMEALAETLFESQRNGQPPDEQRYLERARRALGPTPGR